MYKSHKKTSQHLNPTHIPFITGDQSGYALMKQLQWQFPNEFAEQQFFVGMGGLHIEMAILSLKGFFVISWGMKLQH